MRIRRRGVQHESWYTDKRDSYGSEALSIPSMGLLMLLEFWRGDGQSLSLANVSLRQQHKKGSGCQVPVRQDRFERGYLQRAGGLPQGTLQGTVLSGQHLDLVMEKPLFLFQHVEPRTHQFIQTEWFLNAQSAP